MPNSNASGALVIKIGAKRARWWKDTMQTLLPDLKVYLAEEEPPVYDLSATLAEAAPPLAIPEATEGGDTDVFTTETLADLYIKQGFYGKAADVYRRLLRSRSDDSGLKQKLEEVLALERMQGGQAASPPDIVLQNRLESQWMHDRSILS